MIAFIGSVFSPYYAWMRRRGDGRAERHCALNISLYGGTRRWAMTERGEASLHRDAHHIAIGPSSLSWRNGVLEIEIRERSFPIPHAIRGRIRVHPEAITGHRESLDPAGLHRWSPMAPRARVEVELDQPGLRWSGNGYLDSNDGDGPLEASFRRWDWCRVPLRDRTAILYDVEGRDGQKRELGLQVARDGSVSPLEAPTAVTLPRTRWRLPRFTRCDTGGTASVVQTLQDSPFYARSVLQTRLLGETAPAMHESLDLDRFKAPWTQAMLPFRIPRALR
ncbi:carotenoid 1,2-hydratase [Lichenicola sp.]|uniref:carotenoid 1,2-hydratase n=1 Tax=Lichenicola sp. TaxID=2804529 RepID=UPI003AFFF9D1